MGRVIQLAAYAHRRRAASVCDTASDETDEESGSIHVLRRPDGSRSVTLRGIYAQDHPYAIEALADAISQIASHMRRAKIP
jgi:hypothetical protein